MRSWHNMAVTETPAESLLQVARALRGAMATASPELPPHLARALRVVVRAEGLRPGHLAERMRIAPRTATECVDGLVERGLVERLPDPSDRRAQLVVPTDAGLALHERVGAARGEAAEAFFGVLTDDERRRLAAILDKLDHDARPLGARGIEPRPAG